MSQRDIPSVLERWKITDCSGKALFLHDLPCHVASTAGLISWELTFTVWYPVLQALVADMVAIFFTKTSSETYTYMKYPWISLAYQITMASEHSQCCAPLFTKILKFVFFLYEKVKKITTIPKSILNKEIKHICETENLIHLDNQLEQ